MQKKQLPLLLLIIITLFVSNTNAQNVAINNDNSDPDASAILDLKATDKGLLIPRMSTSDRTNISTPATSLLVYDTDENTYYFYNGAIWTKLGLDDLGSHTATTNLQLNGNWLSNDGGNEGIYIDASGNVGIGISNPSNIFDVAMGNASSEILDANFTATNAIDGSSAAVEWQSFTALSSGELTRVELEIFNAATGTYTVDIYEGEGTSGTLLFSGATAPAPSTTSFVSFTIGGVNINAGEKYTIAFSPGDYVTFYGSGFDAYTGGTSSYNPNMDYAFKTYVKLQEYFSVSDAGVTISNYLLPNVDGSNAQVLTTNGSGTVSWADIPSSADDLGNHTATTNLQLNNNWLSNDGGSEGIYVDASGNVGIGDDTPEAPLEVKTSSSTTEDPLIQFTTGNGRNMKILQPDNADNNDYFTFFTNNSFQFRVDTHDVLSLESTGKVNINNAYTLPNTDGSNGQVLTSNGSGTITWADGTADDLGNHTATTNLQLNGNWLSNDGGSEGIYVDASGNIGINTDSPSGKFEIYSDVAGSSTTDQFQSSATTFTTSNTAAYQTFQAGITGELTSVRLQIQITGSYSKIVRIYEGTGTSGTFLGTTTVSGTGSGITTLTCNFSGINIQAGQTYSIYITNISYIRFRNSDVYANGFLSLNTNFDLYFVASVKKQQTFIVTNTGLGINNSSPSVELDVDGDIEYTGTITDVSDKRLKENFEEIDNPLESIKKLNGYTYNMKNDTQKIREYGVIAQEVQKVFPEAVKIIDKEKGYLGVSYIQLVPILLEALKEQNKNVEDLETRLEKLETLEAENIALKTKLNNIAKLENRLKKIETLLELEKKDIEVKK